MSAIFDLTSYDDDLIEQSALNFLSHFNR